MPFTLAHPALVLPFAYVPKKWVSMTGLIVGSMMPDIPSVILMTGGIKETGHSWSGLFWFCLPVGLLFCFIYHNLVRDMFISHLPRSFQLKLFRFQKFPWNQYFRKNWLIVALSILAGAASHLFWDGFSHFDGFLGDTVPSATGNIRMGEGELEVPYIIQYVNSIIGMLVIAWAIWKLPEARGVRIRIVIGKFWFVTFGIALVIYVIRMSLAPKYKIDDALFTAIAGGSIGLIISSFLFSKSVIKDAWAK